MKILQKGTWLKKPKTCFEWKEQFHWHKAQRWTSNEWDYLFVSDPKLTFYSQIVDENKIQEEIDHLKAILKKKKKNNSKIYGFVYKGISYYFVYTWSYCLKCI